jgi:tRNA dimethylallyltransferase
MPHLIVITGPTASGKTAATIRLAEQFKTEILSADSRQFYRGMNIGTAKPDAKELNRVKHHFIDSLDVNEKYNVNRFEKDAINLLNTLFKKHNVVFMTGGSGLYINAVCHGIDELPDSVPAVREKLNTLLVTHGLQHLQHLLLQSDPEYYGEADVQNPHRVIRALEVIMLSGKKYSALRKGLKIKRDFSIHKIALLTDREELYERINRRVDEMIARGLVEEVKSLLPYRNEQALHTVGYKEIISFLDKTISLEQAILLIKQNTRNYAKRQMTWLRKDKEITWKYPEEITRESLEKMIT